MPDNMLDPTLTTIAVLHPGAMGARLGGECRAGTRLWVSEGRSPQTAERAAAEGLRSVGALNEAVEQADMVLSVCPPAQAHAVAEQVAALSFEGTYVDANAVAPATARAIAELFSDDRFVDGGIIGLPPTAPGTTRLYLSSSNRSTAEAVAQLWSGSALDVRIVDGGPGAASALKMSYAAWTKGSAALLTAVSAAAEAMGVRGELEAEWAISQAGLLDRLERQAGPVAGKAWRFEGEMHEIAAAFADVDVPNGFWTAAADVYRRMAPLKDAESPGAEDVISRVLGRTEQLD